MAAPKGKPILEVSAGGLVRRDQDILMVKVKNLRGQIVWTFPKGHLEAGENAEAAALREVEEETGWRCRLDEPLMEVRYMFQREGRLVSKTVHWYLMTPLEHTGAKDPDGEIMDARWTPLEQARSLVVYDSDKKILQRVK